MVDISIHNCRALVVQRLPMVSQQWNMQLREYSQMLALRGGDAERMYQSSLTPMLIIGVG